ncbi:unnamed protein product [Xylocopa violacea]|uniref:G-protein coupled receptors family 1 profile domain-containing protein n=1 Tax=Xylocopa violacea TaxID=135666 RepID=A0ABP1NJL5_XYLVO
MLLHNETLVNGPLAFMGDEAGYVPSMRERFLGWNVPPEHSELVHPHWRGFIAPAKYWHIGLALIYLILLVMSVVGNFCVVWIFSTSKSLRTPSNMFIVSLAIFDVIMAFEMPMFLVNSFLERMIGWEIGCDVFAMFGSVSGMGQAITNAAIAFDRYRTISCPIDGRLNSKQAAVIIALTWFWVTPFSTLPLLRIWGRYTTGEEDEREVAGVEPGQGEERRAENRESGVHHILPIPSSLDAVRDGRDDRGIRQSRPFNAHDHDVACHVRQNGVLYRPVDLRD